jgi:hypothetical protein
VTEKLEELVAVPAGEVTAMGPVVVPVGTLVATWLSEIIVKLVAVPLKVTDCVEVNPFPVIVTLVPTGPPTGAKELIAGAGTVKLEGLLAVPLLVVTLMGPVEATEGTMVLIWESETTLKFADVPLKVTLIAPVNPAPLSVTFVPADPEAGVKEEIVSVLTVKLLELVAVPPRVVTLRGPVVAALGT